MTTSTEHPLRAEYEGHLAASRGLAPATVRNYVDDLAPFLEYLGLQNLVVAGRQHMDRGPAAATVRDFVERHGSQHVASEYRKLVRDYVAWLLERRQLQAGRRTGQRGHQRASVIRCLAALRSFFRYLVEEGLVPNAPIWSSRSTLMRRFTPKAMRRLPDTMTAAEVVRLLEAPRLAPASPRQTITHRQSAQMDALVHRDRALLETLYSSGLRVSEAAGLDVGDLDLTARTVRVMGKGQKARMVPVGRPAVSAVRHYLRAGRPPLAAAEPGLGHAPSGEALFLSRRGVRLSVRAIQDLVRRHAAVAGLRDGVHPHTLRHSFATHLLDGGADLRIVQELLGHSTPSATQVYTHISQAEAQRVYLSAHPLARREDEEEGEAAS